MAQPRQLHDMLNGCSAQQARELLLSLPGPELEAAWRLGGGSLELFVVPDMHQWRWWDPALLVLCARGLEPVLLGQPPRTTAETVAARCAGLRDWYWCMGAAQPWLREGWNGKA